MQRKVHIQYVSNGAAMKANQLGGRAERKVQRDGEYPPLWMGTIVPRDAR